MTGLPVALQAHLDAGATTLAWCWRLETRSGDVHGFTDHDRDLSFGGLTYAAGAGDMVGAVQRQEGFSADTGGFAGLISSPTLDASDLQAGVFDGARIEVIRVNWATPDMRWTVWTGRLGDVSWSGARFEAELRGEVVALDEAIGRRLQRRCDAKLGDARCGVDLAAPGRRASGLVALTVNDLVFDASGLEDIAPGHLVHGTIAWTSGDNVGAVQRVRAHALVGGSARLELSERPARPAAEGDGFDAVVGCDKRWSTCRDRFANIARFRGFPMMPGNDWLQKTAAGETLLDGGSLWPQTPSDG